MNTQDLFFNELSETMLKKIKPMFVTLKDELLYELQRLLKIKEINDEPLTVPQVMEIYQCRSRSTVYALINNYGIKNIGIGRTGRYSRQDIERAIALQKSEGK